MAAFVAGMSYGAAMPKDDPLTLGFTDDAGELLSLLVWFAFGATMVVPGLEHAIWQDAVFAVVALTVVRMVPVALALVGSHLDRATVAFVGWFGPRGLASVVFSLIAIDSLAPAEASKVLPAATVTVLLSVVAHGVTASPFAARYGRHAASLARTGPEHTEVSAIPARSLSGFRDRRAPAKPADPAEPAEPSEGAS